MVGQVVGGDDTAERRSCQAPAGFRRREGLALHPPQIRLTTTPRLRPVLVLVLLIARQRSFSGTHTDV